MPTRVVITPAYRGHYVSMVGDHHKVRCLTEADVKHAVAHHLRFASHNPPTCPVCADENSQRWNRMSAGDKIKTRAREVYPMQFHLHVFKGHAHTGQDKPTRWGWWINFAVDENLYLGRTLKAALETIEGLGK